MKYREVSESFSGIFTIRQYLAEEKLDLPDLIRRLQAGPGDVKEIVSYVFGGDDPLGLDARSLTPEEFEKLYPGFDAYGSELAFDVVVRTQGHPVTVELTWGHDEFCTNSLDGDIRLEEYLGALPGEEAEAESPAAVRLNRDSRGGSSWEKEEEAGAEFSVGSDPDGNCLVFHWAGAEEERIAFRAAAAAMMSGEQSGSRNICIDKVIRLCLLRGIERDAAVRNAFCRELLAELEEESSEEARFARGLLRDAAAEAFA